MIRLPPSAAPAPRPRWHWPSRCAVCHRWPTQPVCEACQARFAATQQRCRCCALAVPAGQELCGRCASAPPPLDACFAAVDYLFPWSGLITHFKFHSQPGLAGPLARLVLALPGLQQTLDGADRVLPMPLAPPRLAERGYNQALLLARQLAPGQVDARLLLRVQDTPPQNQLDRQLRQHNVRHAFALDPLRAGLAAGRHLVLVDDVMTTGASLYSAAMALRQAGAARVSAVVVARTPEYTGEHVPHRPV